MPQSLSKLYLHLVFSTKNREESLLPSVQKEVFSYIAGSLNALGCSTIIVGGTTDHVHALFCMCRNRSISEVVRGMKANTSKWIRERFHPDFSWQQGYGVFSISPSHIESVRHYVAHQEEHHRTRTFQEEFRSVLQKYGVAYNEKYVWE